MDEATPSPGAENSVAIVLARAHAVAGAAGILAAALGVLVLAGWAFEIAILRRIHPAFVAMAPATAVGFVLAGSSLWLERQPHPARLVRRLAYACASAVTVVGLATLTGLLAGIDVGVAPATAGTFILTGLSLLMLGRRTPSAAAQAAWLMLPVGVVAFLAVLGYLYGASALYRVAGSGSMALHTAVAFLILTVGVLAARPEASWVRIFGDTRGAGMLARRLLPAVIVVPVAVGSLRLVGERAGLYATEFGLALMTSSTVLLLLGLGGLTVRALELSEDAREGERRQAEEKIRRANAELEVRVRERTAQLEAIRTAQAQFLVSRPGHEVFDPLLAGLVELTGSEYGFIDELFYTADGRPYLVVRAITDVSWDGAAPQFYQQFLAGTLTLDNPRSLYGEVMTTGQPVVANDAPHDPRRAGLPPGHPALDAFLGLPLYSSGEFVGVAGLANRPGGYSEELIGFLQPILGSCGQLIGAWKTDQRRQHAEAELREANRRLEAVNRELVAANGELESFSYSISHDLRAPLRTVDGYARILVEEHAPALDDDGRHVVEVMQSETRRMWRLIDDLLAFSRLSRAAIERSSIDMEGVVRTVWAELAAAAGPRRLELAIGPLPDASGQPALIRQVWTNLLANAVKFTRGREPGRVAVGYDGNDGTYYVRDNGVGFDMRFADKLFQVFQRLHGDEEFEGSGIGLALVRRIVERHGGRVWAEGAVEAGATFYFTLPARKDAS